MNTPKEIAVTAVEVGKKKAAQPILKILLFSMLAGSFVALASVGANTAISMIENPGVGKLVGALIFPTGLIIIMIAGAELFTGDCLMVIAALEKEIKWQRMLRCWGIVYLGNFIGAAVIAYAVFKGGQLSMFHSQVAVLTIKTAASKAGISFEGGFILGILCNFLVCIAVWMNYAGKTVCDKIAGVFFPVFLFVLAGFEHCIANMYYIPAGLFAASSQEYLQLASKQGIDASALTWGNFFIKNLLPVTLGNIIGGAVLVGAAYWYLYLKKAAAVSG